MHSLSTAGCLDHFGGCFRQPAFSSSLLLKQITAWLMANKTLTPSECRLAGGKWHRAAGCLGSGRFPMMLGVLPAAQKGRQRKADGRGPCRTVPPEHGKGDFQGPARGGPACPRSVFLRHCRRPCCSPSFPAPQPAKCKAEL